MSTVYHSETFAEPPGWSRPAGWKAHTLNLRVAVIIDLERIKVLPGQLSDRKDANRSNVLVMVRFNKVVRTRPNLGLRGRQEVVRVRQRDQLAHGGERFLQKTLPHTASTTVDGRSVRCLRARDMAWRRQEQGSRDV